MAHSFDAAGRTGTMTRSDCPACLWRDYGPAQSLPERLAAPGTTIFRQGEPAGPVAILCSGTVRLFQTLSGGRRQIVSFAVAGDALNLDEGLNDLSAEAIDAVSLCLIDRTALAGLLAREPVLAAQLLARTVRDLSRLRRQLSWIGRQTADERISSFLLDFHKRSAPCESEPMLRLPMSRQDIADHLGLAIETVSRVLGRLAAEGSLGVVPGGVTLLDPRRLSAAVVPDRPGQAPRYRSWKRPG